MSHLPNYRFQPKTYVIEAFQMTKKRRVDNSEWPNWLNQAWQKDHGESGSAFPVTPGTGTGRIAIRMESSHNGQMTIGWDDWITWSGDGMLNVITNESFRANYEPVREVLDDSPAEHSQPVDHYQLHQRHPNNSTSYVGQAGIPEGQTAGGSDFYEWVRTTKDENPILQGSDWLLVGEDSPYFIPEQPTDFYE